MTPSQLTHLHRRQQLVLRRATIRDLERLWPSLEWSRLDRTYPRFAARVGGLVARNHRTSAGLAARYLRAFRVASGLPGELRIVLPQLSSERLATSLRVTSLVAAKRAAAAGEAEAQAMAAARTVTAGAMARLVLDAGRDVVIGSTAEDPESGRWQRVLGGKGCDFCAMLAGRGPVYSAESADFASHDNCGCSAAPVYGDRTGAAKAVREFTPSTEHIPQADKDRAREWMRNHPRS